MVCADNFEDSEEMKGEVQVDIRQHLGIPKEVPFIRFSQLLMNAVVEKDKS